MNWNSKVFYVDGGCRGNHAHGKRVAYGSISDGENVQHYQWEGLNTNNEAEFRTLVQLVNTELLIDPQSPPTVYMDSKLVVNSLTKGWKVKAENLKDLYVLALTLVQFYGVKLFWVPRDIIEAKVGH